MQKLDLFEEEKLNIFIAVKTVKNGNISYNNYSGIFETEQEALESLKNKDGLDKIINATERDLEMAVTEEANTSDWEDIVKVLEVLSQKMYKIKSERVHNFYDKYSREHAKEYFKNKPVSICKSMYAKLNIGGELDSLYIKSIKVDIDIITEELKKRLNK